MDADLIQRLLPIALTHLVAFLLFIWLMNKFAVGPVLHLLDERREKIAGQFDQIAATEKRVAGLREEYEKKIREIDDEARKRLLSEINRGKRLAEEIAENAGAEAAAIIEKAKADIQVQMDKARAEIKQEIIAMVLDATERLIHERLDDARHRQLVGAFIEELEHQERRD